MVANGDAETTNNFQHNVNDGYAFVTITMMHKIWDQTSNQENTQLNENIDRNTHTFLPPNCLIPT